MYKTSFRVSLLVIVLMLPWVAVQAAGLGKLTLNSALGQPLVAEIEIVTTSSDDVASLKASVAAREAFVQAGINYEPVLSTIKASIESRTNGSPYIKLTSPQAVNDPFLMVLMELNWSSGRILREYTVLLDPVESNTQNLAAANTRSAPVMTAARLDEEKAFDTEKDNQNTHSSKAKNSASRQTKKSYGPVKRGDTLSSIARQVSPAGIDLNQMLVALYQANRDAFIADNMNLLKAGTTLKIPEKNEIATIDASTAKAEIKMQTADWRTYRGKLAEISRESPAPHTISQSDQGQITTTLDKKSASTSGAAKEVLKLSSGAQLLDKDGKIPDSNLVDRLRMMEEDAIARSLALKEANERVVMLEKSVENLKQLLELKDSVLAQAQLKAEPSAKSAIKPEAPPEKDPRLELNAVPVPAQEIPITQPAPGTVANNAPISPPPLPPDTENRSWIDQLFDNIEYIAAALASTLLLILLIIKRRRNRLQEEIEEEEVKKDNFSSAMRSRMATAAAAGAATAAATDLAASENTDDELTYQNVNSYSEDEEFDKDAKYYEDNVAKYDSAAESQAGDEQSIDDSQQDEQQINENIQDDFVEEYGQSADADSDSTVSANQIDFDLSDETEEIKHRSAAPDQPLDEDEAKLQDTEERLNARASTSDYALDINFDDSEKSLDSVDLSDSTFDNEKIDFDLDGSDIDLTEDKSVDEIEVPAIGDESISDDSREKIAGLSDEPLEFDQSADTATAHEAIESESELEIPGIELANINLDLDDSEQESEKGEQWQEVETKLDLAKAYQEMDDKEGAKEMLEEVIRDGDPKQKKAAQQMLKSL